MEVSKSGHWGPAKMKGALSRAVLFTERVEEVENAGSLSWWGI